MNVLLKETHQINAACFSIWQWVPILHVKCDVGSGRENEELPVSLTDIALQKQFCLGSKKESVTQLNYLLNLNKLHWGRSWKIRQKRKWAFPEEKQIGWGGGGEVENIIFWKNSAGSFGFLTLPLEILEKTSFHPCKSCKIVWHPLEIPRSKTKAHGNSARIFLNHPWKFHFFLIDSWNFHMLFLQ